MSTHFLLDWHHKNSTGLSAENLASQGPDKNYPSLVPKDLIYHLALLARMGSAVPFFDEHNTRLGSWDKILEQNLLVRLSLIATERYETKIDESRSLFRQYRKLHKDCLKADGCINLEPQRSELRDKFIYIIEFLCSLLEQMEVWHKIFPDDSKIAGDFHKIFDNKALQLRIELTSIHKIAFYNENISLPEALKDIDLGARAVSENELLKIPSPDNRRSHLEDWFINIQNNIYNLHNDMRGMTRKRFYTFIENDHIPEPNITLVIAFLKMYEKVVSQMDEMPERYMKYFYKSWLGFSNKEAVVDRVDVAIIPAKNTEATLIPCDTLFDGNSNDAGEAVVYGSDFDLYLSEASINTLETINICKDQLNKTILQQKDRLSSDKPWPLLCEDKQIEKYRYKTFRLSGQLLELTHGKRRIGISMTLAHKDLNDQETFEDILVQNNVTALSGETQKLLEVRISTAEGWRRLQGGALSITWEKLENENNSRLKIEFTLTADFPEIVPLKGDHFPVLEFYASHLARNLCYSAFDEVKVINIRFYLALSGQNVSFFSGSKYDINKLQPITSFGTPIENNAFIGAWVPQMEMPIKVTCATLSWSWKGMPKSLSEYFAHYYRRLIRNPKSHVGYSLIASLIPQDPQIEEIVQETQSLEGQDSSVASVLVAKKEDAYAIKAMGLHLQCPIFAFGHNYYGQLMTEATRIDSKKYFWRWVGQSFRMGIKFLITPIIRQFKKHFSKKSYIKKSSKSRVGPLTLLRRFIRFRRMPEIMKVKPPCDIQMTNVMLDIAGYLDINLSSNDYANQLCFSHVYPGGLLSADEVDATPMNVWPQLDTGFEIYIGLNNLQSNTPLSLLWHIPITSVGQEGGHELIHWSVLSDNKWVSLKEQDIIRDNTDNLTHSGVITLQLPGVLLATNKIRSSKSYWLRARIKSRHPVVRRCNGVYMNGVTLHHQSSSGKPDAALTKESIKKLVVGNPAVLGIDQKYGAQGGRGTESDKDFYARVARVLRTRKRAVTAWDIEHMVLESFPDIDRAKCLQATKPDGCRLSGHITVIVATKPILDGITPRVFISPMIINGILNFLKEHASQDCQFHVLPPVNEIVGIKANIILNRYADPVHWNEIASNIISQTINSAVIQQNSAQIYGAVDRQDIVSSLCNLSFIDSVESFAFLHKENLLGEKIRVLYPSHPGGLLIPGGNYELYPVWRNVQHRQSGGVNE